MADAAPQARWAPWWALAFGLYTLRIVTSPDDWHFLDNINLPVHETGHLVFAVLGETMAVLGGTLFQVIVPLVFAAAFHRRGDRLGAATGLWWAGQNFMYIARYAGDARAQELPLVGGGEHDWTWLLERWGMLERDVQLAGAFRLVALVTMGFAVWWGWAGARGADTTTEGGPDGR